MFKTRLPHTMSIANKINKKALLPAFILIGLTACASDDDDEISTWSSTDAIYSAAEISDSTSMISENGDILIVWQEQETEVRDDTDRDTEHTFAGTDGALDTHALIHTHKLLYSRTTVMAKHYDASTGVWTDNEELNQGYWEKIKAGTLDNADAGDNSKIIFNEVIGGVHVGDVAISTSSDGDALIAWTQLGQKINPDSDPNPGATGDASAENLLYIVFFSAFGNKTWSPSTTLSTSKTFSVNQAVNTATVSGTVTVDVVPKNKLAVRLNDSNEAQVLWTGNLPATNIDVSNVSVAPTSHSETIDDITTAVDTVKTAMQTVITDNLTAVTNLYQFSYDGSTWSDFSMISDGTGSVLDVSLMPKTQTSGVAVWTQQNIQAQGSTQTQSTLMSNWYTGSTWHTTPAIVNNLTGEVSGFSVSANASGAIWSSWAQSNSVYPSGTDLASSSYDVDAVKTIWANQFSGDLEADITNGAWGTAENIQPDDTSTTDIDESQLSSIQPSIAVDSAGSVLVAWQEEGDATPAPSLRKDAIIRANVMKSGVWGTKSFIVSDTSVFKDAQPIEKTVPNDHMKPVVISPSTNAFTIGWQYQTVSRDGSGLQLFSRDYDVTAYDATNQQVSVGGVNTVSGATSLEIRQMELFANNNNVQMLWSNTDGTTTKLQKSNK